MVQGPVRWGGLVHHVLDERALFGGPQARERARGLVAVGGQLVLGCGGGVCHAWMDLVSELMVVFSTMWVGVSSLFRLLEVHQLPQPLEDLGRQFRRITPYGGRDAEWMM